MKYTALIFLAILVIMQNGFCKDTEIETVNSSGEKATSIRYGNETKIVTLGNGHKVKILSMGPFHFKNGDPSVLVLTYETEIELSNYPKLKNEVDEIWKKFRHNVEKSGFKVAAIRAQRPLKGEVEKTGKGYGFIFLKQEDGTWKHKK